MGESVFPSHQVLCPHPQPTTDPQGLQPPPRTHSVPTWAVGGTWKGMDQSTQGCSPARVLRRVRTLSIQVPTSRPPAREKAMAKRGLPPNQAVLSVAASTESGAGAAQAPGSQEPIPGRGKEVRQAEPRGSRSRSPQHVLPSEHRFKDKSIKNFKTAITEHYTPSTELF